MSGNLVIDDLGHLDGEVLIFGGCYSNLPATRALLDEVDTRRIPPSNVICTGDVVGYCITECMAAGECAVTVARTQQ